MEKPWEGYGRSTEESLRKALKVCGAMQKYAQIQSNMPTPFIGLSVKQKYWISFLTNLYTISTVKVS